MIFGQARLPRDARIASGRGKLDTDCAEAIVAISLVAKRALRAQLQKFVAPARDAVSFSFANGAPRLVDL